MLVTLIISPHIVTKFEYVELFILNWSKVESRFVLD